MVLADVESYLILACRGFLLVGLVSWQTRNLQRGGAIRIAVGAFLLGALGAVAGWRVSRIRIAWR